MAKWTATGCLLGMCACRGNKFATADLYPYLTTLLLSTIHQKKKKKKKTCLIRSANQAPMATVPREAAYTLTCLMRHGPLWDACQKTAQPCGNCSDSGAHWEGNGLENTWSLSFDIDGRSGDGGIILEIFIGCLLCVRHCSRKWVSSMNKILSLSTALLNLL